MPDDNFLDSKNETDLNVNKMDDASNTKYRSKQFIENKEATQNKFKRSKDCNLMDNLKFSSMESISKEKSNNITGNMSMPKSIRNVAPNYEQSDCGRCSVCKSLQKYGGILQTTDKKCVRQILPNVFPMMSSGYYLKRNSSLISSDDSDCDKSKRKSRRKHNKKNSYKNQSMESSNLQGVKYAISNNSYYIPNFNHSFNYRSGYNFGHLENAPISYNVAIETQSGEAKEIIQKSEQNILNNHDDVNKSGMVDGVKNSNRKKLNTNNVFKNTSKLASNQFCTESKNLPNLRVINALGTSLSSGTLQNLSKHQINNMNVTEKHVFNSDLRKNKRLNINKHNLTEVNRKTDFKLTKKFSQLDLLLDSTQTLSPNKNSLIQYNKSSKVNFSRAHDTILNQLSNFSSQVGTKIESPTSTKDKITLNGRNLYLKIHCLNSICQNYASLSSKYCSKNCAVLVSKRRLAKGLASYSCDMVKSKASERDSKEIVKCREFLKTNGEKMKNLRALKNLAYIYFENRPLYAEHIQNEAKPSSQLMMPCGSCGQTFPFKNFSAHVEICFEKIEKLFSYAAPNKASEDFICDTFMKKQNGYCKRLYSTCVEHSNFKKYPGNLICGFFCNFIKKINEENYQNYSNVCRSARNKCKLHVGWEKTIIGEIEQGLFLSWSEQYETLNIIEGLQSRTFNRSAVTNFLFNKTVY